MNIQNKKEPKLSIIISNNDKFPSDCNINKQKVVKLIEKITEEENQKIKNFNILLCGDEEIFSYNMKYLSHNYYTDIITFYYPEKGYIDADVLISVDSVKRNSGKYKTGFESELYRVIIHGILHLCGYDDKKTKQKFLMRKKENEYLKLVMEKQKNINLKSKSLKRV